MMKISVIIPTYNEERNLQRAIARIRLTSRPDSVEIVVVDGKSADRTFDIARALADRALEAPLAGRARQMNQGALVSSGDVLLFLHADTQLPGHWYSVLQRAWSRDEKPAATAFRLRFDSEKPFYRCLAAAANIRSTLTGIPHGDQAIAVSRQTFFAAGGFPVVALMEEYELFARLKHFGKTQVLQETVTTSARRYERNGPLFNAMRNTALIGLYYLGLPPRTLARFYR